MNAKWPEKRLFYQNGDSIRPVIWGDEVVGYASGDYDKGFNDCLDLCLEARESERPSVELEVEEIDSFIHNHQNKYFLKTEKLTNITVKFLAQAIYSHFSIPRKIGWPMIYDEKSVAPELEQYTLGYKHGVIDTIKSVEKAKKG